MTAKRFDWDVNGIWDYQSDSDEYLESSEEICELLNELHEENIRLKSENNMLRNTIGRNEAYINRLTSKGEWR